MEKILSPLKILSILFILLISSTVYIVNTERFRLNNVKNDSFYSKVYQKTGETFSICGNLDNLNNLIFDEEIDSHNRAAQYQRKVDNKEIRCGKHRSVPSIFAKSYVF